MLISRTIISNLALAGVVVVLFSIFAIPTNGAEPVLLKPGTDIQAAVKANPPGTVYVFEPGIYRMQSIVPKDGDVFDGRGEATLNGSRLLVDFIRVGGFWVTSVRAPDSQIIGAGECQPGFPRCDRPEDLYVDDKPLRHVDFLRDVVPDKWHFDYASNMVYLRDDPTRKKVEIGLTPRAFGGTASNVVIRNLTIEKYATPLQMSAVDTEYGHGWNVHNNLVRLNHGVGVNAGPNSLILRNRLLQNGQQGFAGGGKNYVIESNEVGNNNYAGVNYDWEAGGGKVTDTSHAGVIRGNCVYGNDGPGIWADANVLDLIIENNVVFDNSINGIMYEISYNGIIRNNVVADNGKKSFRWFWGPQILISSSSNVQVYGNIVDVPAEYGNAITIVSQDRKPYTPALNNKLFGNTIVMRGTSARIGAVTDVRGDTEAVAANNSMRQNVYHVASLSAAYWQWNWTNDDFSKIQYQGQEAGSTIDDFLPPKPRLDCAFLGLG